MVNQRFSTTNVFPLKHYEIQAGETSKNCKLEQIYPMKPHLGFWSPASTVNKLALSPSLQRYNVKTLLQEPHLHSESHILAHAATFLLLQQQLGSCSPILADAATSWLLQPHHGYCSHTLTPAVTSWVLKQDFLLRIIILLTPGSNT